MLRNSWPVRLLSDPAGTGINPQTCCGKAPENRGESGSRQCWSVENSSSQTNFLLQGDGRSCGLRSSSRYPVTCFFYKAFDTVEESSARAYNLHLGPRKKVSFHRPSLESSSNGLHEITLNKCGWCKKALRQGSSLQEEWDGEAALTVAEETLGKTYACLTCRYLTCSINEQITSVSYVFNPCSI